MKSATVIALVALSIGLALGTHSSRSASGLTCTQSARTMARLELLFGTARPQGPPVSGEEWAAFLDAEVTPRFPAGLTVLHGPGQWRGSDGMVAREQSRILVIWHSPSNRTEADIEAIRPAYKDRFAQESVMRVDGVSCVSF